YQLSDSGDFTLGGRITFENGEYIANETDDLIALVGASGADNTDLYFNLDGAYPILYSNTDTKIGIDDDLEFVGAQTISTSAGNLTLNPTGGNVLFADTRTLAIGGALGQSYNAIGDTTTNMSHFLASDDDLYIEGDLEVDGAAWFDSAVTVAGNMTLTGHLIPSANDTYDLGSSAYRWRDLYLGAETLHLGTSLTDEGTISYNTTSDLFNFSTDATTNADIAFFTDDLYLDKATGYIGIGTTGPDQRLQVAGNIHFGTSATSPRVYATERQIWGNANTGTSGPYYALIYSNATADAARTLHFIIRSANVSDYSAEVRIHIPQYSGYSYGTYGSANSGNGPQVEISMGGLTNEASALVSIIEANDDSFSSPYTELWLKINPSSSNTDVFIQEFADSTEPNLLTTDNGSISWTATPPSDQVREYAFVQGAKNINNSLFVKRDGNVGIGTSTPDTLLEVYGSSNKLRLSYNDTYYTDLSTGSSGNLTLNPTGGNVLFADTRTLAIGGALGQSYNAIGDTTTNMSHFLASDDDLYIEGDLEVDGAAWFDSAVTVAGNMTLTGHLIPSANDTYDLGSSAYRWRDLYLGAETLHLGTSLTDEGTISYNTTSDLFNFSTDATTNADIAFFTDDLYLDKATGYIGIGTTAPASALDIKGGTLATEGVDLVTNGTFGSDANWDKGTGWTIAGGIATKVAGTASNLSQNLGEAASKMYHITFDYTRTAGTLTVSIGGVTHSTSYTSASGSGNIYVYSTGTGDLTFIADATFAGTVDNVVVKEVSASVANTTNRDSAGTIQNELRTTSTNIFLGLNSGIFNVGGSANSALGAYAFRSNTIGTFNSAMGTFALRDNTAGNYNTAMGYYTLGYNTTGSYNSAIGTYALQFNTTGEINSAVGMYALNANTTGSENSAVGYRALNYNTTGSFNSAVGRSALIYNTTGSNNVAMGYRAGFGVSNSSNISNSVLLGYEAGKALLTGGDNNILVGYGAGDNLTTGAKNIVIGYNIDAPTATSANTLNIGNLVYATGLGDGTTLSTGNVGIGTTSPAAVLDIKNNNGHASVLNNISLLRLTNTTNQGAVGTGFEVAAAGDALGFNLSSNAHVATWTDTSVTKDYATRAGFVMRVLNYNDSGSSVDFLTAPAGSTTLTSRMFIKNNGNIGIGDTVPDALLDVAATQTSGLISQISYESPKTLAGSLTGLDLDLSTNVTPSSYNITGINLELPASGTGTQTFAQFIEGSSTLYDFNKTTAQFNVPASFNNAGDVSLAYDLIMTDNSAGYIKFNGPGYVQTSDASGNYDLTLSAANLGAVTVADLFEVSDSTSGTLVTINETGTGPILDIQKSGASKLYMNNGGNVGIGTSTPDNLLSLNKASGDPILDFRLVNTTKFSMGVDDSDSDKFKIEAAATLGGATPAFVITSTGAIGIGTSAPGTKFVIKSIDTSASAANMFIDTTTGSVYRSTSSLRYKDDVQTLQDDFTKILEARPTSFIDKATGKRDVGFIAEEFDALGLSNLVIYDEQGRPDAIKYERISLYQNEVLKEQQQKLSVMDSDLQLVKNDLGLGASDSTSRLTGLELGIGNQESGILSLESRINNQESRIQDLETRITNYESRITENDADTAPAQIVEGASSEQVDLASLQSTLQTLVDSLSNLENVSNQLNTLSASILTVMESNQANTARIQELEEETQNLQQIVKIVEDKVIIGDPNKYLVLDAATGLEINSENFAVDKDGNVKVKGELKLVSGRILSETGILELNPGEASDTVPEPKVVVKGDLELQGKLILGVSDSVAAEENKELEMTTGTGKIIANETESRIANNKVTENSLIYITPTSKTGGQVLFISAKRAEEETDADSGETVPRGFTVSVENRATEDIEFNWWIVERK
ncbi:MAG: hypothetical protein PHW01_03560, partial [Patescibacteria group bacterium]|nr:hypothetical protein [Patescibacteria group bacterium]